MTNTIDTTEERVNTIVQETTETQKTEMSKAEIILAGTELGVDYSMTHSCYDPSPDGLACGSCDSCTLRKNGFDSAGVPDPTRYIRKA